MNRITLEEAQAAYKKTGLLPVRDDFGDGKRCGCPQTALYLAAGNLLPKLRRDLPDAVDEWAIPIYGSEYVELFRAGFDYQRDGDEPRPDDLFVVKCAAFDDGHAIAVALFDEASENRPREHQ